MAIAVNSGDHYWISFFHDSIFQFVPNLAIMSIKFHLSNGNPDSRTLPSVSNHTKANPFAFFSILGTIVLSAQIEGPTWNLRIRKS